MLKKMLKCEKAQSALEYVLLVAALLILVVILFSFIRENFTSKGAQTSNATSSEITQALKKARKE